MKIIKSCKNCECSLYIGIPGDPSNWRHGCDVVTSGRIETEAGCKEYEYKYFSPKEKEEEAPLPLNSENYTELQKKKVTLETGWLELLDVKDDEVCRQRWEEWKRLALATGEKEKVVFWTDTYACRRCKHLDKDWCKKVKLPGAVNPYWSIKRSLGPCMACMGYTGNNGINQGELFDEAHLF
jgi:hypothetical protein